jgi:hypothetical protein
MSKRKSPRQHGPRGARGARGARGERGEPGKVDASALELIARMAQELEIAQRELRVQFTRIAQLQSELDSLRSDLKKATR